MERFLNIIRCKVFKLFLFVCLSSLSLRVFFVCTFDTFWLCIINIYELLRRVLQCTTHRHSAFASSAYRHCLYDNFLVWFGGAFHGDYNQIRWLLLLNAINVCEAWYREQIRNDFKGKLEKLFFFFKWRNYPPKVESFIKENFRN